MVIEHEEIKLILARKLPVCWEAFIVLGCTMLAAKGKGKSPALHSCDSCRLQKSPAWQDMSIGITEV